MTKKCRWENNEKWRRYSSLLLDSHSELFSNVFKIWPGPPPNYKAMDFEPKKDETCIKHYTSLFPFFPLNSWGSLLGH